MKVSKRTQSGKKTLYFSFCSIRKGTKESIKDKNEVLIGGRSESSRSYDLLTLLTLDRTTFVSLCVHVHLREGRMETETNTLLHYKCRRRR